MSGIKEMKLRRLLKSPVVGPELYLKIFQVVKSVYENNEIPPYILLAILRELSRKFFIWPDEIALKDKSYTTYSAVLIGALFIFWVTIAINIYTTFNDVVAFGESLMFLIGVSMVFFKALIYIKNCKKIDAIVGDLIKLGESFALMKSDEAGEIRRSFFLLENVVYLFAVGAGLFLFFTLSMQPILTEQSIPLPALFPFNLQDPQHHPWGSKFVYVFQVLAILCTVSVLLNCDTIVCCCITRIAMNLRILCVRLRELRLPTKNENETNNMWSDLKQLVEFHQHINLLVVQINDAFYFAFLIQIFSSTLMLGTAGFEALLALDNLMVAFKFIFFMFVAVFQLFYWCIIGNIVYYDSQDVAIAGFEVNEWFMQHPALQRNLMFLIQRAQKPLQIRAQPFYPFTMETFTKIIKVSYTSFTLLCNSFN